MRIRIKAGWFGAGLEGLALGEPINVHGQDWTPCILDGEEDPTFFKTAGLEYLK